MVVDCPHRRGSRAAALVAVAALALVLLASWPAVATARAATLPPLTNDLKLGDAAGLADLASLPGVVAPSLGVASGLPTATEPAAFAAGSVAVSIIFPQDTATTSNESWASTDSYGTSGLTSPYNAGLTPRQAYIVSEIRKALDWWQSEAPVAAHLTFVIPTKPSLGFPKQVGVARQPLDIPSANDQLWRHPIMRKLKFPAASSADTPPPETAYDNAVRKANHTDWAFTIYVVDSANDHDKTPGEFPDGAFAYTFALFGPYSVTTYDNATYTPANYDGVIAHEIGHVFGALDEYKAEAGYPSSGSQYSGYLWVRNSNAVTGGTTNDPCIMRGGQEGLDAYHDSSTLPDGGICQASRGQVGWRVTRNGLPDVVDTAPTVTVAPPTSSADTSLAVTGKAHENAWPPGHNAKGRAFSRGISIFTPHDLRYSVDGSAPQAVTTVTDGGATVSFGFALDTSALGSGPYAGAPTRHLLTVQATTGTAASTSTIVWGPQTPVTLTLAAGVATIRLGGTARLTAAASDGGYPIGSLRGVVVGPRQGAAPAARTVTTGAGGNAVVTFAPRFTTTFVAAFTPAAAAGTAEFLPATSGTATVAVRAALTAHAAAPAGGTVSVVGTFRPLRAGVPLVLQLLSGGAWTTVAHAHTTAHSTFRLVYAARAGALHLRVRFAGDARNAAATKALPVVTVP